MKKRGVHIFKSERSIFTDPVPKESKQFIVQYYWNENSKQRPIIWLLLVRIITVLWFHMLSGNERSLNLQMLTLGHTWGKFEITWLRILEYLYILSYIIFPELLIQTFISVPSISATQERFLHAWKTSAQWQILEESSTFVHVLNSRYGSDLLY